MACGYFTGHHSPGPLIDYYLYLKAYSCQQTVHFPACVSLAMLSSLPRMFSHLKTSSIPPLFSFPWLHPPHKINCSPWSVALGLLHPLLQHLQLFSHIPQVPWLWAPQGRAMSYSSPHDASTESVLSSSIYWIMQSIRWQTLISQLTMHCSSNTPKYGYKNIDCRWVFATSQARCHFDKEYHFYCYNFFVSVRHGCHSHLLSRFWRHPSKSARWRWMVVSVPFLKG